jgi:para-aminobenzoate synthetase/4-amino-4-deoxychorismate lyase
MTDLFFARVQIGRARWLSFRDPALVLQADSLEAVRRTLSDVEQLTRDRGLHAAGFVSYEAAGAFGLSVRNEEGSGLPLVWFALYPRSNVEETGPPERRGGYSLGELSPSVDRQAFGSAFERIKEHLAAGNTYQVNFTFRMAGSFEGDAEAFLADLVASQQGLYGAFIDLGDYVVCSASPELFFEFQGTEILSRPMKGTARRGRTLQEDRALGAALARSEKERAENVMIVDMIRNDLGRVAEVGSVEVAELFTVERYPNVWQMTSLVKARSLAPLDEVFAALHPSASVTGAPKVRTMELVRDLEGWPRGVYTGAIGHIPPDGLARFNVAIRTATVDRRRSTLAFGIGSGIVWDSDADAEYAECLLKGSVLRAPAPAFDLLETLLWTPGDGYVLLERHLERIKASAEYFSRPLPEADIVDALDSAVAGAASPMRVRLLVGENGEARTEVRPHNSESDPLRIALAPEPIDPSDVFLFHKTTNRGVYERARTAVAGVDEVQLWNTAAEITEATTSNVIVELDGERLTPPVECGLLPGTYRAMLLESGEVAEARVDVAGLSRASRIWLVNSVQGMREARVVEPRP